MLILIPSSSVGLEWSDLEKCVRWMVPFAMSIREVGSSGLKTFKGVSAEDMHNIQTHAPYLEWLVSVLVFVHQDILCHVGSCKWSLAS